MFSLLKYIHASSKIRKIDHFAVIFFRPVLVIISLSMCKCCPLLETESQWSQGGGLVAIQMSQIFFKNAEKSVWLRKIKSSTSTADNTHYIII